MNGEQRKRNRISKGKHPQHGHRIITLAATIRRQNQEEIASDVLGSYTGTAKRDEQPEQDADDL